MFTKNINYFIYRLLIEARLWHPGQVPNPRARAPAKSNCDPHQPPPWWLPLLSFFISWLHTIVIISFALLHTLDERRIGGGGGGGMGLAMGMGTQHGIQTAMFTHSVYRPSGSHPVPHPCAMCRLRCSLHRLLSTRLWHFVRFQFDVQQSVKLFNRISCIINLCAAESPAFSRPFSVQAI